MNFLITPIIWILALLLLSLLVKNTMRKRRFLIATVIVFYLFTNGFICDEFVRLWEIPAIPAESMPTYKYGIVLAGMASYDAGLKRINFQGSIDRLLQAVDLYHKGKIKKILITGGSGSILNQNIKEAVFLREYLQNQCIPDSDLVIEPDSRNTRENAVNTARILRGWNSLTDTSLLITSALHLRRARACFARAGVPVQVYATDRLVGKRKFVFDHLFLPDAGVLGKWNMLIHEILGYQIYKFAKYA